MMRNFLPLLNRPFLTKLLSLGSYSISLVIFLLSLSGVEVTQAVRNPVKSAIQKNKGGYLSEEWKLLDLTNRVRVRKGLQPLRMNSKLAHVARNQSLDMARHHHLSHSVKGKNLGIRIKKSGYIYRDLGENVAKSKKSSSHVVHMWMRSSGHRKNILNPNFTEMGAGIKRVRNGTRYFTQVFGSQR
jgi:uncharacterized protein YkwD